MSPHNYRLQPPKKAQSRPTFMSEQAQVEEEQWQYEDSLDEHDDQSAGDYEAEDYEQVSASEPRKVRLADRNEQQYEDQSPYQQFEQPYSDYEDEESYFDDEDDNEPVLRYRPRQSTQSQAEQALRDRAQLLKTIRRQPETQSPPLKPRQPKPLPTKTLKPVAASAQFLQQFYSPHAEQFSNEEEEQKQSEEIEDSEEQAGNQSLSIGGLNSRLAGEYVQKMEQLRKYIESYGREGDNEYTHKLLFDFYRAQGACLNQQEDQPYLDLYDRFFKGKQKYEKLTADEQKVESDVYELRDIQESMFRFTGVPSPKPDSPFLAYYNDLNVKKEKMIRQHMAKNHSTFTPEVGDYSDEDIVIEDGIYKFANKVKSNRGRKKVQNKDLVAALVSQNISSVTEQGKAKNQINGKPLLGQQSEDSENEVHFDENESDIEKDPSWSSQSSSEESYEQALGPSEFPQSQADQHSKLIYRNAQQSCYNQEPNSSQVQQFFDEPLAPQELKDHGRQRKIHGQEEYHGMRKSQKQKYFKRMTKDYHHQLRRVKQALKYEEKKAMKEAVQKIDSANPKTRNQKFVNFSDSIYYKSFWADARPHDVLFADEKQEVLFKAIWEYDQ